METAKPETISTVPNSDDMTSVKDKEEESQSQHPSSHSLSTITPQTQFNVSGGGDADNEVKNNARRKPSSVKSKFDDPKLDPTWLYATLRKEINQEASYHLENDAKLRAVTQGTVNYEQFRQMVLGAHIRPLEKNDKVEGCQNGKKPHVVWNTAANSDPKGCQKPAASTKELEPEGESIPKLFSLPLPLVNQCQTSNAAVKTDEY